MTPRLPLRARLTALYAAIFVLSAGILLILTLILVDHSLTTAAAANAPAQRDYVQRLEKALNQAEQEAGKDPTVEQQKRQADLKQQLIDAQTGSNATVRDQTVNTLLGAALLTLAVLVPTAALGSWLLARRALRPVGAITAAARRASERNLHERLALAGPRDEITELAGTFDDMLARLEHAFDAQRRFVANASHELRTPLTVARTAIDVTMAKPDRDSEQLERMAADVHGAVDRAERLVDGLLMLTRSEQLARAAEPVDLATAAQDALDSASLTGIEVRARLDPAPAVGDRALIDRLVGNLVDNALRHNGSSEWLTIHTGLDGPAAVIEVSNPGPALDPARVPALFEPFHRANGRARSSEHGLGLGLSIVKAVAAAHHAIIYAVPRPDGGLTVTVRFPTRTDGTS